MLLHVHQGDAPQVVPFPQEVALRLESLKLSPQALAQRGPGSRQIELKRR